MLARRGLRSYTGQLSVKPAFTARPSILTCPLVLSRLDTRQWQARQPTQRAWESNVFITATTADETTPSPPLTSDEKDTGHIAVEQNESILFFDNIFPLKLTTLTRPLKHDYDLTDLLNRFDNASLGMMDPIRLVKNAIPEDMSVKVTKISPRLKDGGAFVRFQHDATYDPIEIEREMVKRLTENPLKPWFNPFRSIKARLVRGTPWLEDLYRYPSKLIRVEFVPPEPGMASEQLSEENLFTLFRKYGKIADIMPQPTDSKVEPRYAMLAFPLLRDAIMARNCMHGLVVDEALGGGKTGTRLRISFEKRMNQHSIWNWIQNHPRIVIPIVAALLATLSVIIFDPIRQFFIKLHIQHSFDITNSRIWKWFKSQTNSFSFRTKSNQHDGLGTIWNHRRDLITQLQDWLTGSSDSFIVVNGPRGSGKVDMVMNQSLQGRRNVLMIDCKAIIEARGEAGTIRRLATAVGYRPVFSWANGMSSMIDLAVQSTTGVKAGFSETLETQVVKILHITSAALKSVALSGRGKKDKDANLSEDAFLEAHPEKRPVIVIDNFGHKTEDGTLVYDKMAEWAASVVQNNVAHVIFLTSDSSASKFLTKALPDRVFREIALGDLEPEVAKNFVLSRLEEDQKIEEQAVNETGSNGQRAVQRPDLAGLDESIRTLGGRLTDLEILARRLKAGQLPREAINEVVNESATDVVKMFLLGKIGEAERKWSTQQAWYLVRSLAEQDFLRYNSVMLSPTFASSLNAKATDGETALEALAAAELISISFHQGRPSMITAGKPLYQAAFQVLQIDTVLKAKMELSVLTELAKVEAKSIETVENELSLLGSLPRQSNETTGRVVYLMGKLGTSQKKISALDAEMGKLKKVLEEKY